jgi:hypothetical protein
VVFASIATRKDGSSILFAVLRLQGHMVFLVEAISHHGPSDQFLR